MKKLNFLFFVSIAFLTGLAVNVSGQTVAKKNSQEVFINKKGEVHNHGGTKLGYITKDDILKNADGKTVYFIDQNGNVIDAAGKNLGKAQKNGTYYNNAGATVITARDLDAEKCAILDAKGHSLGTVHKNYKLHACAAHCLALEHKKMPAKK